ncbi:hypothetical protein MTO96_000714 [Rhipicephalus appendiculatus]
MVSSVASQPRASDITTSSECPSEQGRLIRTATSLPNGTTKMASSLTEPHASSPDAAVSPKILRLGRDCSRGGARQDSAIEESRWKGAKPIWG